MEKIATIESRVEALEIVFVTLLKEILRSNAISLSDLAPSSNSVSTETLAAVLSLYDRARALNVH